MKPARMDRVALEGIELEFDIRGVGDPVVFIHPGHFAEWFAPLLDQPALVDRYRLVTYHRVGCAGSSRLPGAVSFAQQAAHCGALMRHLGIKRAHVVGHSSSAAIALQFALDAPDVVHSLALLEPAFMAVPSAQTARAFVGTAMQQFRSGDKAGAVDTFLKGTCGPDYRRVLDAVLPDAFDQHVADADTFFGQELPALQQWSFTPDDARRIRQPALAVIGAKSRELSPIWEERHQVLLTGLPNVEPFTLAEAGHLLEVENPRGMAEGLAAFFARYPIGR